MQIQLPITKDDPNGYKAIADKLKKFYGDDHRSLIKLAEHLTNGRDSTSPDPKSDTTRIAVVIAMAVNANK